MKAGKFLCMLISMLLLNGCILDRAEFVQHIVKDFNLGWQGDPRYQALFVNVDHSEYGGIKVIEETVFAVGWDQNFIIALQYPNRTAIKERILSKPIDGGYLVENSNDIKFLETEFVSSLDGNYIYDSSGVGTLDQLFPYKQDTVYYILDIRDYTLRFWSPSENVYRFETRAEYQQKKKELKVPATLKFKIP